MKKILSLLISLVLVMSFTASAAPPPMPMPFVVYVKFNGAPVVGLDVTFDCASETIVETSNDKGGVAIEVSNIDNCPILTTSCGYAACYVQYNTWDLDYPYYATYHLGEAPPEPEPECTVDSDCDAGYECISEECSLIPVEPEPVVEDKVTSNEDNSIALIEANYGETVDVVITDNQLSGLIDTQIDFDTEDYDVHEEIRFRGELQTSLDNDDFGIEPRLIILEGEIEYRYVFDDIFPDAMVEQDEELEINFLGEDIEIINLDFDAEKMTIRHGEIYDDTDGCVEGQEITFDGKPLRIISVNEDAVYVSYDGDSKQIYREDLEDVAGIQVYVDEAIPNEDGDDLCSIRVAIDIEEVIDDGDEYVLGWDYTIADGYIGIRNTEDYKYLDEEYVPLVKGDKITLPNDFAVIKFHDISTSDVTDIGIKVRDGYLNVIGDREDSFSYNNQDYDELYVDAEGIKDEDKVLITTDKVRIGESDIYLEVGSIIIGDLEISLDFADITYKGVSYSEEEETFLDYLGIIFKDPEGSVASDSTFDVIVPDETPEVSITIGAEPAPVEPVDPVEPIDCPEITEADCVDTICPPVTTCPTCPTCPELTCPPVEDCPEIDDDLVGRIITGILSAVGGAGIFFKLFNNKIFTGSNTGIKSYRGRDGDLKIHHKHPGTRGYHNPDTQHRAPETHPKGMVDVSTHYQKNSEGEWEYK